MHEDEMSTMGSQQESCSSIEAVARQLHDLKYMGLEQARLLRDLIWKHGIESVLELGFYHGKSTAFMAAILEERGSGHIVTMDHEGAKRRTPPIDEVLDQLGLRHRVTPVYAQRSFTWELGRLIEQKPSPRFDFCYIDGAHTWDGTGFSFFLVDILLKPGGWVLFDDLNWTIAKSPAAMKNKKLFADYPEEERRAQQVRKVWELLVPARGYVNVSVLGPNWGLAQKPLQ